MMASVRRSKRIGVEYTPGFYKALDALSTADLLDASSTPRCVKNKRLQVSDDSDGLPQGCFEVERVVASRIFKVSASSVQER